MARKVKASIKAKKKKWVAITAPKIFLEHHIGESYVEDAEQILGQTAKVNLMTITNDPKMQNINVTFRATHMKKDSVGTEIIAYEMLPASIKRFVRRGKVRIDMSFITKTSDGIKMRIKPFVMTRNMTNKSVATSMRAKIKEHINETLKKTDYYTFVKDVVAHKFQKGVKDALQKTYPTAIAEIRMFSTIGEVRPQQPKPKVAAEKPAPAKVQEAPKREVEKPAAPKKEEAKPVKEAEKPAEPKEEK